MVLVCGCELAESVYFQQSFQKGLSRISAERAENIWRVYPSIIIIYASGIRAARKMLFTFFVIGIHLLSLLRSFFFYISFILSCCWYLLLWHGALRSDLVCVYAQQGQCFTNLEIVNKRARRLLLLSIALIRVGALPPVSLNRSLFLFLFFALRSFVSGSC